MANKYWIGGATNITDEWTITFANTWAAADTATLTVAGDDFVFTVGTLIGTTDIADAFAAGFNAQDPTSSLVGDESLNVGGQQIAELRELTATVDGSVVTLKHNTPGVPVPLSIAESTVGTGTATLANSVPGTGENFFDNADNWQGGVLPVHADVIIFNSGSVDVLYGLSYMRDNTLEIWFTRTTDYFGRIGLPDQNPAGYLEYRDKRLELYDAGGNLEVIFDPGEFSRRGGITRLDCQGTVLLSLRITDSGDAVSHTSENPQYNVEIYGGDTASTSECYVGRGSSYIGLDSIGDPIVIGSDASTQQDTVVVMANPTNASDPFHDDTLTINGGKVDLHAPEYSLDNISTAARPITINGGLVTAYGAGEWGVFTVQGGGTLVWKTVGYIQIVNLFSTGYLDLKSAPESFGGNGITTLNIYGNSRIARFDDNVPLGTTTFIGCNANDVNIEGYL